MIVPDFSAASVLVIGDVMLDRYWYGETSRVSPEAPVPVVHVRDVEERAGGAGNVALNVAAMGARAVLAGVTGEDEAADTVQRLLEAAGVTCRFQRDPGFPTVTKLRVVSRHQQLIRLDFEQGFHALDPAPLLEAMDEWLDGVGAVVLSDYGKGALSPSAPFIARARAAGVPVLVDPKQSDFSQYRGASLVTPNRAEFEAVVGPCPDEDTLAERGAALMERCGIGALLVTRGEEGMTLMRPGREPVHLPTQALEVYDVTGAGDTVIGVMAAALALGRDLRAAMRLANLAAGVVVGKLGTATVTPAELQAAWDRHAGVPCGVMDEARLLRAVERARSAGESIVMTNGVFDILHAGHVRYLREAAALGDRLIVAVNDDDSVRRLKGGGRPVNPLAQRMEVLAALGVVDWVVPFSEDTPERLVCAVRPDVLVKGGDYRVEEIAGRECAGQTRVLPFAEGHSTTGLIHRIRSGARS
jgi:D-beta-D-heptose 7-phosphate kinase/D-beta-D-heptose 1-phosphate adenosyltransferase